MCCCTEDGELLEWLVHHNRVIMLKMYARLSLHTVYESWCVTHQYSKGTLSYQTYICFKKFQQNWLLKVVIYVSMTYQQLRQKQHSGLVRHDVQPWAASFGLRFLHFAPSRLRHVGTGQMEPGKMATTGRYPRICLDVGHCLWAMPCVTLPLAVTGITVISLHDREPTAQQGHVECRWEIRTNTKVWSENFKATDHPVET
jgi:hypothetical protein